MSRCDVVILTWNDDPAMLDTAVVSALAQHGCDVRVHIVDNGSVPPARSLSDERVVLLRQRENLGVGGGRNVGVAAGDAPFVCLLDSDARLHDGALERLLRPMLEDATVGLTAPVFTDQRPDASGGRAPTLCRKIARGLNRTDVYACTPGQGMGQQWDVDFVIGACQVFRRDVFESVGGIDASAVFGPEDVDFCLRVRATGSRVVQVAGAGCDHPPRRAFKGLTTARGMLHGVAVVRHLWRHRRATVSRDVVPLRDVEHALQRDARPLRRLRIDDDLIHELPPHE